MAMIETVNEYRRNRRHLQSPSFTIPVKFIHFKDPAAASFAEQTMIDHVDTLNEYYADSDCINFSYDSFVEDTSNADWEDCPNSSVCAGQPSSCQTGLLDQRSAMGAAHNVGSNMTIFHVFICDAGPVFDGYAYYPWTTPLNNMYYRNLNAAYMSPYTFTDATYKGTLPHEAGHWLGKR